MRLALGALLTAAAFAQAPAVRIDANDLKADVSFLASDALEGRATPSKGLDVAAEFIASQFRRAGLEPCGDDGYFQTAPFLWVKPGVEGAEPGPNQLTPADPKKPPARNMAPVTLRNVAGILRGSDAALKDTYLVLTAHYDHLGIRPSGDGDRIFNGANDDASGTASLIEIAHALAALPARPKRSIVFLALFGEEIGEIGSLYYVSHPLFPLAKTIADINLEQLGRTDDLERPKVLEFNLTGFGYSTLGATFQKAAEAAGVHAVNDEPSGDSYFEFGDNVRFADAGVPDTTIAVAYMFPDYHAVGDEWPKLDYENMAKVARAVALGVWDLANSATAPEWNAAEPKAARYLKARQADK